MEPKDISDRAMTCFESFLSQVNTMYFNLGVTEPKETLNELASRISNNQNGILMAKAPQLASKRRRNTNEGQSLVSNDFHYSTLDMLWNPLRVAHVFENWSPREIAIFETWIWKFGKKFGLFSKFIKTKTTSEVIDFYLSWKSTSHHKIWKQKMESHISEDHNDWVFK